MYKVALFIFRSSVYRNININCPLMLSTKLLNLKPKGFSCGVLSYANLIMYQVKQPMIY